MVALSIRLALAFVFLADAKPPPSTEPTRFAADRPVDIKHIALELRVDVPAKHVEEIGRASCRERV